MKQNPKVLDVTLNLTGTIIGAGIFGLPAVMAKTGIVGGSLLFFGLLILAVLLHMVFMEVVLGDRTKRRLAGYAGRWVGGWAYWLALITFFAKSVGAILAYLILGGEFLSVLAHGLGWFDAVWFWQLVFWAAGAIIVFFGLSMVTVIEDELTWLLIGAMLFTGAVLVPFFDWQQVAMWHGENFWQALGIMFFAVMALTVIPESVDIAGRKEGIARKGVFWGTVLAGVLSWIFGVTIALAYPSVSSAKDIYLAFPPIFWWLVPTVGILAIVTSYITVTQALKNLLTTDVKLKERLSWFIAVAVPLVLFALTSRNFLNTIGFVGGVLTGIAGLIICLCAWRVTRQKTKRYAWFWRWVPLPLALVLVVIVLQELWLYARM